MKPIYAQDRSALRSESPPFAGFYRVSAPLTSPKLPSHRIADLHAFALKAKPPGIGALLGGMSPTEDLLGGMSPTEEMSVMEGHDGVQHGPPEWHAGHREHEAAGVR